jgi:hypothetical protein
MALPLLRSILSSFLPSSAQESTVRRAESCLPLTRPRGLRWPAPFGRGRASGDRLASARLDFADALDDVRNRASLEIQSRIAVTRSLHELWHFREEVFSLVACRHDQAEATRRLAQLNRHFAGPGSRSPRAPGRDSA